MRATPPEYRSEARAKPRLNGLNSQPNRVSITRPSQSFFAPCGLSRIAASAGDRVSELIAEITVEIAMVSANCR